MIPTDTYVPLLRTAFSIVAQRRGAHWQLRVVDDPAFGRIDEAQNLAEAIAGVMKYVPIPDRELGVAGAIGNLALALYATVGTRLSIDAQLAALSPQERAQLLRMAADPRIAATANGTPPDRPAADAASALQDLGTEPIRSTVERDASPTVGRVTDASPEADARDPNEVLIEHVRPGQPVASVQELVDRNEGATDLLDNLAPVPEVDGQPVQPEL